LTFDQQLQHTLETFSERLRSETARALAALTDELASAVAAERAAAAALLTAEARLAAEQEAGARLAAALAAAEREAGARVADALAAAEREAAARDAAVLATAEREAAAREAAALAAAEREAGARLAEALATAEREADAKLAGALAAAEREASARVSEAVAAAEQKAGERSADAVAAAEQEAATLLAAAVASAEARGREAGLQTGRDEGREEGRQLGRDQGRQEGREEGRREGRESGRIEGFARGQEQGREEGRQESRQEGVGEGRDQTLARVRQEGREDASAGLRATELAANERLVEAVRTLDRARSLSEILDTLASCAGREAKRVGILLVRHGQLRGWRFIGFGPGLDERTDYELRSGDAGVIADAARTGLTASADSATPLSTPAFAELPPGREVLALPVPMSGQVVAVLYADQGPAEVSDAALRVAWPAMLEVMARHAARCLEAITAFRAAQVLTERPDAPSLSGSVVDSHPGSAKAPAAGEHEDADEAAKRYARLLVSEIKLYHEAAVIAGRRERDLMTRLGGEIARARVLYDQRVPADVRGGTDHFHNELVRTLANGDAGLLEARS
jgi:flagellar biosynthesis/type III secretory pathway protein FliH